MRIFFAVCTALSLSIPVLPAIAADSTTETAAPQTREQRLDRLFSDLKHERNPKAAERIAGRIWAEWNRSGSATL